VIDTNMSQVLGGSDTGYSICWEHCRMNWRTEIFSISISNIRWKKWSSIGTIRWQTFLKTYISLCKDEKCLPEIGRQCILCCLLSRRDILGQYFKIEWIFERTVILSVIFIILFGFPSFMRNTFHPFYTLLKLSIVYQCVYYQHIIAAIARAKYHNMYKHIKGYYLMSPNHTDEKVYIIEGFLLIISNRLKWFDQIVGERTNMISKCIEIEFFKNFENYCW